MATTADIRNGLCIDLNGELYQIIDFQHVKPGKGPAFVRTKLKQLKSGKVIDNTFTAGVKITTARVVKIPYQFLYRDESGYVLMNTETFEQLVLQEEFIESANLIKEGQEIGVIFHEETETPLFSELPAFVDLEVTYTEPGIRGDTATASLKPATLETGATVLVPLFVNIGDCIKVDTRTLSYVERVKR
jgi:elongation factor P